MSDDTPRGRTCGDCVWWRAGECRRFPPAWAHWPHDNRPPIIYMPTSSWPQVGPDQWCGEWASRAEENA